MATRSIVRAQVWIRSKTEGTCYSHPGKEIIYCCKNELCDQALACMECVTTVHQGHCMEKFGDTIMAKAEIIQQVVDKTRTSILPDLQKTLTDVEDNIKNNKITIENSVSEIRRQQECLRSEVDRVTNEMVQRCREVEKQNNTFLEERKDKLLKYKADIEMRIEECDETLNTGTNFQIHDLYLQVRDGCNISLPKVYILRNAFYTPYRIKTDSIDRLHGLLNVTDANLESGNFSTSLSEKTDPVARQCSIVNDVSIPLLSQFEKNGLYDVRPSSRTDAWIFKEETNLVLNVSNTGQIKQKIKLDYTITDCCKSPQNQILWICCDDRSIWKYSLDGKSPRMKFYTRKKPVCIYAVEMYVIVGYEDGLTSYKPDGEIIVESGISHLGHPTVSQPFFIAVCPVTGRIAVTDRDKKGINKESRPHIVILDESLKMQFCYGGYRLPKDFKGRTGISISTKELDPFAISFDACGNLLVADCSKNSVIQLDRDGNMVRTIFQTTGGLQPYSLQVSQDNILWLVLGKEKTSFVKFKRTLSKIKVFDLATEDFTTSRSEEVSMNMSLAN